MKARLILLLGLGCLLAINAMPAEEDGGEGEEGEEEEGEEEGGEEGEEGGDGEEPGGILVSVSTCFYPGCQNEGEGGLFGKDYEGNVAKTVSGLECQKWSEQKPHKHKFADVGEHNFCRNPDDHKGVWCYTTDKKKRWEACDVPKCDIDCQTGDGKGYKGEVDKTVSGKDCQDWAEQTPHKHKFEEVGEHNFCRNPDNHTMVWCYTTDKKKRWEKCDVPQC